jgi:hypothetical protein
MFKLNINTASLINKSILRTLFIAFTIVQIGSFTTVSTVGSRIDLASQTMRNIRVALDSIHAMIVVR